MPADQETPAGDGSAPGSGGDAGSGGEPKKEGIGNPVGTVKEIHRTVMGTLGPKRVIGTTLLLLGIGGGALLLASGFSFWWTSQPSFCGKCHPMQVYIDGWERSPHAEENCEHCHIPPGLFGFMGGKIAALQVVMNYVRGNYEDYSFSAAVPNASCLRCHEGIMAEDIFIPDKGLKVSHRNIIGAGAKCVSCHNTVGHDTAVPAGARMYPTMDKCMGCHNDIIAPSACQTCHTDMKPGTKPPAGMVSGGGGQGEEYEYSSPGPSPSGGE